MSHCRHMRRADARRRSRPRSAIFLTPFLLDDARDASAVALISRLPPAMPFVAILLPFAIIILL